MPEELSSCNLCGSKHLEVIDLECNISVCLSCGYVFDNPRPTLDEITAYYSYPSKYDDWLEMEAEREALWKRRLKKIERHKKRGNILDIGTGTGQFLHVAKGHFTKVYGTEISESGVEVARKKYGLDVMKARVEEIYFPGRTFDNITLFHVLEHVPSPLAVVKKCHEMLEPGGVLFVAVPNELYSLKSIIKKFLKSIGIRKRSFIGKFGVPRIVLDGTIEEIHLSHFTPPVLAFLLTRNGFSIVDQGLDPYYVQRGWKLCSCSIYYAFLSVVMNFTGMNLYDTQWIVAKKIPG